MVADVAQCVSRQELTDFACGRMAAERFDEIAMHVDTDAHARRDGQNPRSRSGYARRAIHGGRK